MNWTKAPRNRFLDLVFVGIPAVLLSTAILTACNGAGSDGSAIVSGALTPSSPPDTSSLDPSNSGWNSNGAAHSTQSGRRYSTAVLLFNGTGISTSDWQSVEQILKGEGLSYRLVNSAQLNAMSLDEMASFGMMLFPGGTGSSITNAITTDTRLRIRQAVRDRGMSFLGICAGAWVAVGPEFATNATASYGFAVAQGSVLDMYYPGGKAPTAAMVDVKFADGSVRNLVWWGGPITPEWPGGVIARYETGDPAISQTWSGKGFVVVSGPHPEAPQGWRSTAGTDSDGLDDDVAIQLIRAALDQKPLEVL